jgi:hypothetical protein
MSELATLFKEPETSWGVFYPKNYVIATFHSFSAAASRECSVAARGVQ